MMIVYCDGDVWKENDLVNTFLCTFSLLPFMVGKFHDDGDDYCHDDDCEEKVFVVHFFIVAFHGKHASVECK